ncbi:MAG: hypothetical protein J6M47_01495 [Clostridia bacterium]|nr:hypothetical protein [Clostridia bacterium]
MKQTITCLLALLLVLLCAAAGAQTLPGIDCFSPGLIRVNQAAQAGAPVTAEAQLTIDNALYARDLSVLAAMLDGTAVRYAGETGADSLVIEREGRTLFSGAMAVDGDGAAGAAIELGGETYLFPSEQDALAALPLGTALAAMSGMGDPMGGLPVLERVPLDRVAAWMEGLAAGDEIAAGYTAQAPFVLERTMSDDGTRLVRIDLSGSVAGEDGSVWAVEGFMRQPAGRAPKDTFEMTFTKDEDNMLELLYSSLRENTITRKNAAGETTVDTTLKLAGKLGGYGISSRLRVRQGNKWTADGENLSEKITVTATLTHQDKTPGRRMQRLNEVSGTIKNVISLTTKETDDAKSGYALSDALTLEVIMDGNTFLKGGAQIALALGGEESGLAAAMLERGAAKEGSPEALEAALADAVQALSAKLYPMLGEAALEKIEKGL